MLSNKYIRQLKNLLFVMFGLFLYALGILLAIHSRLGAAPWDTFQLGLTHRLGLSLGRINQIIGALIIVANICLKQIPGRGTLLNMYFIGFFIDLIEKLSLVPDALTVPGQLLMLLAGIAVIGWGTFFYINAGWGAGPRDGLMLGLSKRLKAKVWQTRMAIEVVVATAGFTLGSKPGIGTVLFALLVGPAVQMTYRIGHKDPGSINHTTLVDDYRSLVSRKHATADIQAEKSRR